MIGGPKEEVTEFESAGTFFLRSCLQERQEPRKEDSFSGESWLEH